MKLQQHHNTCLWAIPSLVIFLDFVTCAVVNHRQAACSGQTLRRRVGYYQGANTWQRPCHRVFPHELDTDNYTHLVYAFATIEPRSFSIQPLNPADSLLMRVFATLKSPGLQTWVSVGGNDFSQPGSPTANTW